MQKWFLCVALAASCVASPGAAYGQFDLNYTITNPTFFSSNQLSILEQAVAEGATLIRVGSALFEDAE